MISINPIISSLIARSISDEIVVRKGLKSYTYNHIYNDSRKLATYLESIGMRAGDTALIATPSSYEFLLIFYASLILKVKIGIIDPKIDNDLYLAKVNQLKPQWAFIDSKLLLIQEHNLLKKFYLNSGDRKLYLPQSDQYQTIATGAWMPLMRSYEKFNQYKIHKPYDIDPSYIDYEYIISYTSGAMGEANCLVHTLGTISHSTSYISKLIRNTKGKSFVTDLPHFMLIGIAANLRLEIWNDKWTIPRKIKFIETNGISMLSTSPIQFLDLIEYCKENNRKLPTSLEHIIVESTVDNQLDLEECKKYIESQTCVTVMYSKTVRMI